MKKIYKQLTFDLDTKVAETILGDNYKNIYRDIRKFADENGFKHIEGSVYMSKKPISNLEVTNFIIDLKKKYNYLDKCVKKIHQSDITNTHSLSHLFNYDGTAGEHAKSNVEKDETKKLFSKKDLQNFVNDIKKDNQKNVTKKELSVKRNNDRTR